MVYHKIEEGHAPPRAGRAAPAAGRSRPCRRPPGRSPAE